MQGNYGRSEGTTRQKQGRRGQYVAIWPQGGERRQPGEIMKQVNCLA